MFTIWGDALIRISLFSYFPFVLPFNYYTFTSKCTFPDYLFGLFFSVISIKVQYFKKWVVSSFPEATCLLN